MGLKKIIKNIFSRCVLAELDLLNRNMIDLTNKCQEQSSRIDECETQIRRIDKCAAQSSRIGSLEALCKDLKDLIHPLVAEANHKKEKAENAKKKRREIKDIKVE